MYEDSGQAAQTTVNRVRIACKEASGTIPPRTGAAEVTFMHFVERIFHLSPDHGNGTLETFLFLAILAGPVACAVLRRAWVLRTRIEGRLMSWRALHRIKGAVVM